MSGARESTLTGADRGSGEFLFADEVARRLGRLSGFDASGPVGLAVRLAVVEALAGHVCVELDAAVTAPETEALATAVGAHAPSDAAAWEGALRESPAVARPGGFAPLVLDDARRLYLHRAWRDERAVVDALRSRADATESPSPVARIEQVLDRVFPDAVDRSPAARSAAASAVSRRLTLVSGGPGTGKTTAVVRILAALSELAVRAKVDAPKVALAAPTGKAAARLAESVREKLAEVDVSDAARAVLPREASTLHRLLGAVPGRGFRYGRERRLPHDVVIVDEASMVDLGLFAALSRALRDEARLVVLGDRDQLVSVEAGSVFGDVCEAAPRGPLAPCLTELTESYRFSREGGIGRLASAIREGDPEAVLSAFGSGGEGEGDGEGGTVARLDRSSPFDVVVAEAAERWAPAVSCARDARSADAAVRRLDRFRVLCGRRGGPRGVGAVSTAIESALEAAGAIRLGREWYPGRPVIVTANDPSISLYNGDVGMTYEDADDRLRVAFGSPDGTARSVSPARVPPCETVFAMTIHKSQGSEFNDVCVLMPEADSRVATRELLYTAVTRARRRVIVHADEDAVRAAVGRRVRRASGLVEALSASRS